MSELDVNLAGKSLADYTNTQLRVALGTALYTNTADMWHAYLVQQGYSGSVADMMSKWYVDNNVPYQFRNYISAGAFISSAAFSPASLFTGGYQGAWYDPSDLSTMFQDTAGTVPVTADGQTVARINDKSGNGNHLTQATAAARPLYKTSAGKHWLEFDGVDDFMQTASALGLSTPFVNSFMGIRCPASGLHAIWNNNRYLQSHNGADYRFTTTSTLDYTYTSALVADTPAVLSTAFDTGFDATFRKNGAAGTTALGTVDGSNGEGALFVGDYSGGLFYSGRIYQLILIKKDVSGADLTSTETYTNGKTGAY